MYNLIFKEINLTHLSNLTIQKTTNKQTKFKDYPGMLFVFDGKMI